MTTLDILKEIIQREDQIDLFTFHNFPRQKLLQDQFYFGDIENGQFDKAMKMRKEYKLPFWDSMMLTFFDQNYTSDKILECSQRHNKPIDKIETRDIDFIITKVAESSRQNIAINSRVKMVDGTYKHFPLLDFHIPISPNNELIVKKVIKILGFSRGYIMESGESYHFIGLDFITNEELTIFLSKALLFSPIIDRAWIAHQLLERSCSLRVSFKHNIEPQLIYIVDDK